MSGPRTWVAKWVGFCPECETPIEPGDECRHEEDGNTVHVDCTPTARRPEVTCTVCFMIKPCECDDA